jgi:UDP-N-acetyl-2-amino-2-deoxyglucuronate dehydrogenase
MASPAPLGFGIIGLGLIADFHARAIADAAGAKLVAVCGRDAQKARAFAAKYGAEVFSTHELTTFLARPDLDAVCIATPSGAHLEPTLAAARAGKHIVIEKPIEITLERMDQLLAGVAATGVKLMPIFQARFGEGARAVKAAVAAGRLGRLTLASAYVKWQRTPAYYADSWHGTFALDGGGALINQAIHAIDLLQWYAGLPAEVFSWNTRRVHTGIEVEDTAVATLRYPDGALGTIEATTAAYPGWARRIELCGEKGSIVLEDDRIIRWDFRSAQPGDESILAAKADDAMRSGAGSPGAMSHQGHLRQIENLVAAIRHGDSLRVDGPEARKAVALILALYRSAQSGQAVRL